MTAREIISLLFRHRLWLLACLLLPPLVAGVAYSLATPHYQATARLLVASNQDQESRSSLNTSSRDDMQTTKQEVINSELEILTGNDLETAAIQHFGLARLFPGENFNGPDGAIRWDKARRAFDHALASKVVKNSEVIEVRYDALDPGLAEEVLGWDIAAYQQKHVEVYAVPMAAFLNDELDGLEKHGARSRSSSRTSGSPTLCTARKTTVASCWIAGARWQRRQRKFAATPSSSRRVWANSRRRWPRPPKRSRTMPKANSRMRSPRSKVSCWIFRFRNGS